MQTALELKGCISGCRKNTNLIKPIRQILKAYKITFRKIDICFRRRDPFVFCTHLKKRMYISAIFTDDQIKRSSIYRLQSFKTLKCYIYNGRFNAEINAYKCT